MSLFGWFQNDKRWTVRLAISWTVLIYIACLIPGNEIPNVHIPFIDKWIHILIFAGFVFLWLCVFHKVDIKHYLLTSLLAILVGYSVEWLQGSGITRGRSFDWNDVLADTVGGVVGVLIYYLFTTWEKLKNSPK